MTRKSLEKKFTLMVVFMWASSKTMKGTDTERCSLRVNQLIYLNHTMKENGYATKEKVMESNNIGMVPYMSVNSKTTKCMGSGNFTSKQSLTTSLVTGLIGHRT